MEILQQQFAAPSSQEREHSSPQPTCKVLASRQLEFSELVLDVAWLLKKPEQKLTSSHIQRSNCLFEYLMEKDSTVILNGLYCSLRSAVDNNLVDGDSDSEVRLLQKNMDTACRRLAPRSHEKVFLDTPAPSGNRYSHSLENDMMSLGPSTNQVHHVSPRHRVLVHIITFGFVNDYHVHILISQALQRTVRNLLGLVRPSPSLDEDARVPLLKDEVIMKIDLQERPRRFWGRSLSRTLSTSRLLIMAVMAVGVCFGVCAVFLHPQRVGWITSAINSCLFDNSRC